MRRTGASRPWWRQLLLLGSLWLLLIDERREGASARGGRKIHLAKPDPSVNPKHDHISFDPLVGEVERHLEDKAWEQHYEKTHPQQHHHVQAGHHHEHEAGSEEETIDELHDEDAEHEEFLHDAGIDDPESLDEESLEHVDMVERLEKLFPLIDLAPKDGKIDVQELANWELRQYKDMQDHRMQRELETLDADGDGRVSLEEYIQEEGWQEGSKGVKHWSEYPEDEQQFRRQEQERFHILDEDKDGFLDLRQVYMLLHPEESDNPQLRAHMREEECRAYDTNEDGKIDLKEWIEGGMWDAIHEWEEEERKWAAKAQNKPYKVGFTGEQKRKDARERFKSLDKNNDQVLVADELEPIMFILLPGERHFAVQTARHLLEQADDNGDNRLTLEEMKQHKQAFYDIEQGREDQGVYD